MAALPREVLDNIDSYLELIPGVEASDKHLKTLLDHTLQHGFHSAADDLHISIVSKSRRKQSTLAACMEGPIPYRPHLCTQEFPATEQGLLEALLYLKTALQQYREAGTCSACKDRHKYHLRLKADGMPYCERCVLNAAVGL